MTLIRRPTGASDVQPVAPLAEPAEEVAEVVVTGTFIRGAPPAGSPVHILTRDAMDRAGHATVEDALAALPQNFSGVSTPQTQLLGTDGLGTNLAASNGVNLRGLGATSTLVLVNGRRMAGSGFKGDFADVSAIPAAAVDHIEVLLDGASAIYGSDAVGGVVNILLRKDFDGVETRLRGAGATQGGDGNVQLGQTIGHAWTGGHLLISYEYRDEGRLASADRAFTADQDLRPLGGTDHRVPYAHPANVLSYDPDSGAFLPAYGVPAGQNGRNLQPSNFLAGQPNLENSRALADTLPAQQRHSLYLNLAQSLTPRIEVELDARYTRRTFRFDYPENLSVFSVDGGNPYYVSPDGASSELLGYAFGDETGPILNKGEAVNFGTSVGAVVDLGASWKLDAYASLAQDQESALSFNLINSGFLNEALGAVPDDPATPYVAARDGYFNPFGDGGANSPAVLRFIDAGTSLSRSLSRIETLSAHADGPLLRLPGGPLQLALGLEARRESFTTSTVSYVSDAEHEGSGGQVFRRSITAGFAELRLPVFGAANALPGFRRFDISLAGRIESYSDVGIAGTPKVGILWSPLEGVALRTSYSRSFRAPGLPEVDALQEVAPTFATRGSDQVLSLVRYGGDPNLKPETATSWTAGVEWKPSIFPHLVVSAGWFDIAYQDRIGQPVLEDFDNALTDPAYARFVTLVSPSTNPADAAQVQKLLASSTSAAAGLFPASAYGAIIDARYVNAASFEVRGFDLSGSWEHAIGPHHIDAALDATYLTDYLRRVTPAASQEALAGLTGYPARLRLRQSFGWSLGSAGATFALNYVSGSHDLDGQTVGSWTTIDLQLSWTPQERTLKGLVVSLTAQNLLGADPPFYNGANGVGFDPANADALGRVVALQVAKRW